MNQRKKQIMDVAHRLFVEKGYVATSIQDILDSAEISKGTFYNYFNSKNECLMAILEFIYEETKQKRTEIAHGKPKDSEELLAAQIAIRMDTDRKHSLMALFSSVSLSDNTDLRELIGKQHNVELQWVARRLTEIHGPRMEIHGLDFAVILLGIINHCFHILSINGNLGKVSPEKVIHFAMRHTKSMMKDIPEEILFDRNMLSIIINSENTADLKDEVIVQLKSMLRSINKEKQNQHEKNDYVQFLIDELEMDKSRVFLLESVLISLSKTLKEDERKEHEVVQLVWKLIEKLKMETG